MCDQPTPAMPEHASHPVAWSAVIAPCARPCLHICPPEVTARPSVTASSLACAQAFGNGPRRKAAAVGGERAIHGIAGESRSAPSELLAATMAATAARLEVASRRPAQAPAVALAVPSRARTLFAQRATCVWSKESV